MSVLKLFKDARKEEPVIKPLQGAKEIRTSGKFVTIQAYDNSKTKGEIKER